MSALWSVQWVLMMVLGVAALGVEVFAFVDVLRTRADAFTAAGKLTKNLWLLITAVAAMLGLIFVIRQLYSDGLVVLSFIPIVALVASSVYMVDVRPAVRQVSGGGSSGGPYGGW